MPRNENRTPESLLVARSGYVEICQKSSEKISASLLIRRAFRGPLKIFPDRNFFFITARVLEYQAGTITYNYAASCPIMTYCQGNHWQVCSLQVYYYGCSGRLWPGLIFRFKIFLEHATGKRFRLVQCDYCTVVSSNCTVPTAARSYLYTSRYFRATEKGCVKQRSPMKRGRTGVFQQQVWVGR